MAQLIISNITSNSIDWEITDLQYANDTFYFGGGGITTAPFVSGGPPVVDYVSMDYGGYGGYTISGTWKGLSPSTTYTVYGFVNTVDPTNWSSKGWIVGSQYGYTFTTSGSSPVITPESVVLIKRFRSGADSCLELSFRTLPDTTYIEVMYYKKSTIISGGGTIAGAPGYFESLGNRRYSFSVGWNGELEPATTYVFIVRLFINGIGTDWSGDALATTAPTSAAFSYHAPGGVGERLANQFSYRFDIVRGKYSYAKIELRRGTTLIADDDGEAIRTIYFSELPISNWVDFSYLPVGDYTFTITTYYFVNGTALQQVDSNGDNSSSGTTFSVTIETPQTPSAPTLDYRVDGGGYFNWPATIGANAYNILSRRNWDNRIQEQRATGTSVKMIGLTGGTAHSLHLIARNEVGTRVALSRPSSENTFTTSPSMPVLNITSNESGTISGAWNLKDISGNVTTVWVRLYDALNTTMLDERTYSTTSGSFSFSGLSGSKYYIHVLSMFETITSVTLYSVDGNGNPYEAIASVDMDGGEQFQWVLPKETGQPFNLLASEWLSFQNYINQVRVSKGLPAISFTSPIQYEIFLAAMYNECGDAIKDISGYETEIPGVSTGQVISAYMMNIIVSELNDIP